MTDKKVRLSSKYQIVIPKEAREQAHLKAGDYLFLTVSTRGNLMLWKKPKDYAEHLKGLGSRSWQGVNIKNYLAKLRKEW